MKPEPIFDLAHLGHMELLTPKPDESLKFFVDVMGMTISGRKGRMAFCNASEHEKEILKITKLDSLWDICATREESLRVVQSPTKPGEASA